MYQKIEEELLRNGYGFFQTVGDSMEPLLHNRKSTVVIQRKKERLKLNDVALYRRPTGEYVLHRVIKVLKDTYLICGDNRVWKENVPEEWVIGVMTGFYEDERDDYISCNSKSYRKYLRRYKVRFTVLQWKHFLGKGIRKLIYFIGL